MKAVLFLCLLAFMTCENDIIDIGKCIYKAPVAKEIINEAIKAIINKDFSKLLPKVIESLPDLIQVVVGCLNEKTAIEDEPKAELVFGRNSYKKEDPLLWVFDPKGDDDDEESKIITGNWFN